jgi:hypothetical protein
MRLWFCVKARPILPAQGKILTPDDVIYLRAQTHFLTFLIANN